VQYRQVQSKGLRPNAAVTSLPVLPLVMADDRSERRINKEKSQTTSYKPRWDNLSDRNDLREFNVYFHYCTSENLGLKKGGKFSQEK
jgi:hypothetical protein